MPSISISIDNKFSELDIFLKKNKAPPKGAFTHTSISGMRGSYFVKNEYLDEFFNKYYDHVFVKKLPAYLTEGIRDCQVTPIKIDLDFRAWQAGDKPNRLYEMEDIVKICQLYMKSMEEWLVKPDPCERECFILEKEAPVYDKDKKGVIKTNENGEKRVKDGVHILFPKICTKTFLQLEFRNMVYKNCGEILDKYNYDNGYADIFDRAVIDRNNWQMYGSTKNKESYTYRVTKIVEVYTDRVEDIALDNYNNMQLVKLLSVRNKQLASLIKYEKQLEISEMEEKQEAMAKKRRAYSTKNKQSIKNKATKDEIALIIGEYDIPACKATGEIIKKKKGYIDCLSIERAINFDTWIEVGWALHNIDNCTRTRGSNKCILLQEWINWSKRSGTGYEEEEDENYINEWNKMRNHGLGIGSLKIWAKEDAQKAHEKQVEEGLVKEIDLTLYEKIVQDDLYALINKACGGKKGGTSYDVAKVMNQMYKDSFICVSIKDSLWFYYDTKKHRWREDDKGITLKSKISTEVWKKFNDLGTYFAKKCDLPGDEWEDKRDKVYKTAGRLKETSFKGNIMTECAELFYDSSREFYNKLDSNMNLIGYDNGIYNLVTDEFRKGRPEDYVSMSTGIDFIEYDPNSTEVLEINKFLEEILTNKAVREYVLQLMSTFLSGSTKNEKFHVWSGSGGNGKSKLIELLEKCIGDYAGKMNISNLTSKRSGAGAASPEMARTKGKRFVNLQEPDEKCKLNVGLMKELTGGDKIIARALFKEPIEFKPQFKMVLTCNDKPELPPDDEGTWRRIVLVEYRSKFRHEPKGKYDDNGKWIPQNKENPEFPIDESLNERFEDWAEPFMSILINTHKMCKNKDLREPIEVKQYTEKYREQNDHFKEFVNDRIRFDPNSDSVLKITGLYEEYKIWFKNNNGDNRGQKQRKELRAFMDKQYGQPIMGQYSSSGYRGLSFLEDPSTSCLGIGKGFLDELDDD